MSQFTGYGNDGIGLTQALQRFGADVYLQPTHVDTPLPEDILHLFGKAQQAPFDLYINHIDPMSLKVEETVRTNADVTVGWTMWEYSSFGNMPTKDHRTLRKRLKDFDAMVGYSDIDIDCIRPYYKGPIIVRQGGFNPEDWPELERDWTTPEFYFCMIGILSPRKAPFAAIQAFSELRQEHEDFAKDARLSLKTMVPGLHSAMENVYPNLRIFYDVWPQNVVRDFYQANHVLLSPSRGEGKNMPALEFMSTGGTVIATNWAGHKQWLHSEYNYALDYTLEPDNIYTPDVMNATADVEHLKKLMLHVFRNRVETKHKGELAAQIIPQQHSWDYVVEDLFAQLRDSLPTDKGQKLWNLTQTAKMGASRGY